MNNNTYLSIYGYLVLLRKKPPLKASSKKAKVTLVIGWKNTNDTGKISHLYLSIYGDLFMYSSGKEPPLKASSKTPNPRSLAFTRYSFTSSRLCTSQSSFHSSRPPALPTLLQYYCRLLGNIRPPPSTSLVHAIHHTIVAIRISCKG